MYEKVIPLGIDRSLRHIKPFNSCFVSGVAELDSEPMVHENILKYNVNARLFDEKKTKDSGLFRQMWVFLRIIEVHCSVSWYAS